MIPTAGEEKRGMGMYMALSQCGMEMVAPTILGIFLDRWLGTIPWLTVVLTIFGFVGGITHMVIMSNRIAEYEAKKKAKGKTKMKKYVLRLDGETINSPAKIESVKEAVAAQGARNIEVHALGLVTVDSEVSLNFAAIAGIEDSQEVQEAGTHSYVVALNEDADREAVEKAVYALGAVSVKPFADFKLMTVGSNVALDVAELSAIAGVKHARPEQKIGLVKPVV